MKKRILFCSDDLSTVNGYTLVPRYLAKSLRSRGVEAKVLCTGAPHELMEGETTADFLTTSIWQIVSNKANFEANFDTFSPDVVYTNGIGVVDYAAANWALKHKVKLVSEIHTRIPYLLREVMPLGKLYPDYIIDIAQKKIMKGLFCKADMVISAAADLKNYLRQYCSSPVMTLSNGVDLHTFPWVQRTLTEGKKVNMLCVANIERRKNQIYLLKVMKYLPHNYRLNLVGSKSWDKEYYLEFLSQYKLTDKNRVVYHGPVIHTEVPKYYKQADIFLFASHMEIQSLSLIEAVCSGIPVVRLYSKNTFGITKNGVTGIHVSDTASPQVFAQAIMDLVQDTKKYRFISMNQKAERDAYSWDRSTDKIVDKILT